MKKDENDFLVLVVVLGDREYYSAVQILKGIKIIIFVIGFKVQ